MRTADRRRRCALIVQFLSGATERFTSAGDEYCAVGSGSLLDASRISRRRQTSSAICSAPRQTSVFGVSTLRKWGRELASQDKRRGAWQDSPRSGSGVVSIDPLRFLTGCRKRRLNEALSVYLSLVFLSVSVVLLTMATFALCHFVFYLLIVLVRLSVPLQVIVWKNSSPKWSIMCFWGRVKLYSLTHSWQNMKCVWISQARPVAGKYGRQRPKVI